MPDAPEPSASARLRIRDHHGAVRCRRLGVSGPGRAVVRSIVQLCQALGLSVVAEGVELDVEREALLELGVTHGQGYLFGEPVSIDRLEEVVRLGSAMSPVSVD